MGTYRTEVDAPTTTPPVTGPAAATLTTADAGVTVAPTTLVGPNGTAPNMGFVQPAPKPVDDSSPGRAAGLPLAIGALVVLVVFLVIVLRAVRARRQT